MNKRERKEFILECARTLFVQKGFHATTVADIIEKARIARSTFYAHFSGKEEIFSTLVDAFSALLVQKILAINISRASANSDLSSEIHAMTLDLIEFLEQNADMARLLITAPQGHDSHFDKKIGEFFGLVLSAIKQLLDEGIADGNVRACRSGIIALAILGCIKQVMLQWLVFGEIADIRDVLDDIIRYNLYGIALNSPR
jgi:AcrR family transcriptional regulator